MNPRLNFVRGAVGVTIACALLLLALSLDSTFPYRDEILNLTFGVVVFSILVQGLSIKPVLRMLRLTPERTS